MRKFKKTVEYYKVVNVHTKDNCQVVTIDYDKTIAEVQISKSYNVKTGDTLKFVSDFGVGFGMVDTFTVSVV